MNPAPFLVVLRRAAEADPRVLRDAARLWRRWKKAGQPPVSWTIHWNEGAMALFREAAGLDVMHLGAGGVYVIDFGKLCEKIGDTESIYASLSGLIEDDKPPVSAALSAALHDLQSKVGSDGARRWIQSLLDGGASRLGCEIEEIGWVARALDFLDQLSGREVHCSDLGSRVGASSKYFRPGTQGRRLLADALLAINEGKAPAEQPREAALEEAGVRLSPTAYAVLVAGPLSVGDPPLDFPQALARRNEAVLLSLQNLDSARLGDGCEGILTIENEASFLSAMKEGLHSRRLLVETSGFPNRAVLALLSQVISQADSWSHWGDTDLAGIRIARMLESRLGRSPTLFRCAAADVRRLRDRLICLTPESRVEMAADLKLSPSALGADVLRTDLAEGGWLEQEAWELAQ